MTIIERINQLKRERAAAMNDLAEARDRSAARKAIAQRERRSYKECDEYIAAEKEVRSRAAAVDVLNEQIDKLTEEQERDEAIDALTAQSTPTGITERSASSTQTRSRDVYSAERDRSGERSYFSDMFRSQVLNDVGASQRIAQHQAESRAGTTTTFAGLVPPSYLLEQAALVARAGRPFADSVTGLPLTDRGMSLIIPRSTTGAAVASQATENTNVQNTDEVWSNVTLPVATIAGQQVVSRQSLERGDPGIDALIFTDLIGAYAAEVDRQCLSGSGASGQMLGVLNTAGINQATAFTAAATVSSFYTKVAGMISAVSSSRGLPPDTIAMHPRRYAWLLAQLDSQNRPLVTPAPEQGPTNTMGVTGAAPSYGRNAGTFLGLSIVVDINLPTSVGTGPEDQVLVYRAADLLLYEENGGTPSELRFDQPLANQLSVMLVAYGYCAFTAGRAPGAVGVIGGNAAAAGQGLVAPAF